MKRWLIEPSASMVEPVPAPEIFVDTIGAIERFGSIVRVYYCTDHMIPGCSKALRQTEVVAKLIWPVSRIHCAQGWWQRLADELEQPALRLVKKA